MNRAEIASIEVFLMVHEDFPGAKARTKVQKSDEIVSLAGLTDPNFAKPPNYRLPSSELRRIPSGKRQLF